MTIARLKRRIICLCENLRISVLQFALTILSSYSRMICKSEFNEDDGNHLKELIFNLIYRIGGQKAVSCEVIMTLM